MKKLIEGLFLMIILFSCSHRDRQVELLQQAQQVVEDNPSLALNLLDSISDPKEMGKDYYMQYIVTRVQAKYKDYQDIKDDSIILVAQQYFEKKGNSAQATVANFYTRNFYYENNNPFKELEYANLSEYHARKSGNNLYIGKNLHSKGSIYYDMRLLDSAIVNYKRALHYYQKCDAIGGILDVIRMIGISYNIKNNTDSAYFYLDKGLHLARQKENKAYQTTFTHMLGANYLKQKNYRKASEYVNKALLETKSKEERNRIYITLVNLYTRTNQLDSAGYFSKKLEAVLPEITYLYTIRGSYNSLTNYYQKAGDYPQTLIYKDSVLAFNKKISEFQNLKKVAEIEHKHTAEIQQKEMEKLRIQGCIAWICAIAIIVLIGVISYFRIKQQKQKRIREEEKNRIISEQLEIQNRLVDQQQEILSYMQEIYSDISNEWVNIEKEVQKLTKEFGVEEVPPLFLRIKQLVENFKQNTNRQLIELAKGYFLKFPYGEKAIASLNEREMLVFMLYYCGYTRQKVSLIVGVKPTKGNMLRRKLQIRNKLVEAGMPVDEISKVLFTEDD